ncbi:MAG: hypothetical protein OET16_10410 [Chromatiales bacterium]|jgi:hypothetical protein|nr:hypothetical protein [Chromatiales bacterium]PLX57714.1 MAG: hypothetical protein C0629_00920 [Chromatiales bacterium]
MLIHGIEAAERRYRIPPIFMGSAIAVMAVAAVAAALVAPRPWQRRRIGGEKTLFPQSADRIAGEGAHLD